MPLIMLLPQAPGEKKHPCALVLLWQSYHGYDSTNPSRHASNYVLLGHQPITGGPVHEYTYDNGGRQITHTILLLSSVALILIIFKGWQLACIVLDCEGGK